MTTPPLTTLETYKREAAKARDLLDSIGQLLQAHETPALDGVDIVDVRRLIRDLNAVEHYMRQFVDRQRVSGRR